MSAKLETSQENHKRITILSKQNSKTIIFTCDLYYSQFLLFKLCKNGFIVLDNFSIISRGKGQIQKI